MAQLNPTISISSTQSSLLSAPTSTPTSTPNNDDASNQAQVNLAIIFGIIASVLALAALVVGYLQLRKYKRPDRQEVTSQPGEVWDLVEVHTHARRQAWQRSGSSDRDDRDDTSRLLS